MGLLIDKYAQGALRVPDLPQRRSRSWAAFDRCRSLPGSSAGQQGLWLNILEKGFGMSMLHRTTQEGRVSLDAISKGGDTDETISLFTGRKAELLSYRRGKGKEKAPPAAHELPVLKAKTRALLYAAMAGSFMLCAGIVRRGFRG